MKLKSTKYIVVFFLENTSINVSTPTKSSTESKFSKVLFVFRDFFTFTWCSTRQKAYLNPQKYLPVIPTNNLISQLLDKSGFLRISV